MLEDRWQKLPDNWKKLVYKERLFVKQRFTLKSFLWDDSYGHDFILCMSLGIESSNPEYDFRHLEKIICNGVDNPSLNILNEIFSMQYLPITSDITFLSPLKFFPHVRVLDFSGQNESHITDLCILDNRDIIHLLDYSNYKMIDFDIYSGIRIIDNIIYIQGYGFQNVIENIYHILTSYNLDNE